MAWNYKDFSAFVFFLFLHVSLNCLVSRFSLKVLLFLRFLDIPCMFPSVTFLLDVWNSAPFVLQRSLPSPRLRSHFDLHWSLAYATYVINFLISLFQTFGIFVDSCMACLIPYHLIFPLSSIRSPHHLVAVFCVCYLFFLSMPGELLEYFDNLKLEGVRGASPPNTQPPLACHVWGFCFLMMTMIAKL